MVKRDGWTKGLAITGTVVIWIPIVLPLGFGILRYATARRFQVDYLMPGELLPVAAVGAGLLLWAALRARSRRRLIAWAMGIGAAALVLSTTVAVATGLASGEQDPAGLSLALVLGIYAIYPLAVIAIAIGGVLLVREQFSPPAGMGHPPAAT
jgi:hypothetical protein